MTESEKLKHCIGCSNNVYNHGTMSNTGRCWSLPGMKLSYRKEVSIDQRPPWTQESQLLPNCYRKPRFVYVGPNQTH